MHSGPNVPLSFGLRSSVLLWQQNQLIPKHLKGVAQTFEKNLGFSFAYAGKELGQINT